MTLPSLPQQPAGVDWPTNGWPIGAPPASITARLEMLISPLFDPAARPTFGETHALLIIQHGQMIVERYHPDFGPAETCPSWSMAKSITQAMVGIVVADGKIDIMAKADVPEWSAPGDPRGDITLDQLLRMSSGLQFVEDYLPENPSDVIAMLFGEGKADVAGYAAAKPLAHAPDRFMSYSSGTTNIVSRAIGRAIGKTGAAFEDQLRARLFDPLGMTSATPRFDDAGTFIGSSYCFCTPRDFAKFGLLYLRGGLWEGRELLSPSWVDYARTNNPLPHAPDDGPYGAHWWLGIAGDGSFSANGYEGQYIVVVPDLDMVIVRNGATPAALKTSLRGSITAIAELFRAG